MFPEAIIFGQLNVTVFLEMFYNAWMRETWHINIGHICVCMCVYARKDHPSVFKFQKKYYDVCFFIDTKEPMNHTSGNKFTKQLPHWD